MVNVLLLASAVLFVLWLVGLGGVWAAHTAWMLFVLACACLVLWAIMSLATGTYRRRII